MKALEISVKGMSGANIKDLIKDGKILQIVEYFNPRIFTGDGPGGTIKLEGD
jgi:hypothetical protein